ncbi:MAG: CgeB family protein [Gemmatimonadales bacterium]
MRVAVIGAGGRQKTEASIVRALCALGHEGRLVDAVAWARYAGRLSGRAARYLTDAFQPDFLILTRHAIELGESSLRALLRGRRGVFWYFDLHPKEKVVALGRLVGTMYVTSHGQIDSYRAAGIAEVRFLPQGVDPEWDVPAVSAPASLTCDASFVGSGQYPHRYPPLRAVASVSRLEIRGPGWSAAPRDLPVVGGPVHGAELARVIRGAAISLGANAYPEQDTEPASASNRMWKILGCGGFYLGPRVPDIESFAAGGRHCAWYGDAADAAEQVRHYLSRPDERARIAWAGREHALRHHTYAHRLTLLLEGREYQVGRSTAPHTIR